MIKSEICEILGIQYPIFQGGMAWISDGELAAAVSEAGGLGIISAMNANKEYLIEQIKIARKLTDKPFGVNIMLMSPFADEISDVVIQENISVVTTGAGSPAKYMEKWLKAKISVIPVVASVAMAKKAERTGACAVIAEGQESGGHIGELTTLTIVPQVCDAVNIPVIAAGGIADGRTMAASLILGACGVQIGTRFLVAKECNVHQNYKNCILKASDISTVVTGKRFGGNTCRSIKNNFTRNFNIIEYATDSTAESVADLGIGALRKAAVEGNTKEGCVLAGQISGLVKEEQSAKDIITDIIVNCGKVLTGGSKWVK